MTETTGYDAAFLGVPVALPRPSDGRAVVELPSPHFTVLLDPERRLAASTGVNIDGAALLDLGRAGAWHLDERVPASAQAGPEVYTRNDLDRGHLVRRRDPVWGDRAVAAAANEATFAYTNAAPQAAPFNQGPTLWVGLEDHVLAYARAHAHRVSVFTGPVLEPDDPPYRGIRIPRRFWKIAAWTADAGAGSRELRAAGFLLDQTPALESIGIGGRAGIGDEPPPIEPYLTYQVPVTEIGALAHLDVGHLAAADRLSPVTGARRPAAWRLLTRPEHIEL
ncbi:DNA/RNA non-specific endonuclease [Protaetiibacter sp. SSC-01]|uniref:DNA/RNA non-specific endonuclease n=1 Tax=Protaetiibacter sp. SSC-01 TaxID=2759943 RepID=UPI00223ADEF7|nr:DNA/RNA non-specific endonuclease [Protaetiibacter sp. SSC-01]